MSDPRLKAWLSSGDVLAALNRAYDDILTAAELPEDGGAASALSLMLNATWDYMFRPSVTNLEEVVSNNYDDVTLDDVLNWIHS